LKHETGRERTKTIAMHIDECRIAAARAYKTWFDFRSQCENVLKATHAPDMSYSVVRHPNGTIKTIHVFSEFLEKSCVRYWEFEELSRCLRDRSQSAEMLRPYFHLVMKTVLDNFMKDA